MPDDLSVLTDRLTVDVVTAARVLGIGRNAAYEAVKVGEIPSLKIGGRIVVPTAPLRKMLGIEPKNETVAVGR
ncbi:helix-turn-helix domain-containing protein [Ancylobacter sp. FA202]|uniref:helix-turn-helix domain-containing protein n=1 Tax=Ancylobacter sp. FA202 TaxID=1111106 RepID=UPI0003655C0C|nr:helix-turn-helix domain-containing protein [Ancylobacter sp. FA202]